MEFLSKKIVLTFVLGLTACVAVPLGERKNGTILRQDGDDGEDALAVPFETVAGPIAQIISGSLSGNINQLFNGIAGTVTDQEAQPGVGQILTGVSIPLSTIFSNSIAAGQKYFNITTQVPLSAQSSSTTPSSASSSSEVANSQGQTQNQPQFQSAQGPQVGSQTQQQGQTPNNNINVIKVTPEQLAAIKQQFAGQPQGQIQQVPNPQPAVVAPQVVSQPSVVQPEPVFPTVETVDTDGDSESQTAEVVSTAAPEVVATTSNTDDDDDEEETARLRTN